MTEEQIPQRIRSGSPESKPSGPPDSRIPWSELLLRLFREDIVACPCGGRRKVIAFIKQRAVIERILGHLGLPPPALSLSPRQCLKQFVTP